MQRRLGVNARLGHGARRGVMKTNIGNIAVEISIGAIKPLKAEKAGQQLAAFLSFHNVASKAYSKASGHKRDDAYSPAKRDHVVSTALTILGEYFEGVNVVGGEHVRAKSPVELEREKLHASMVGIAPEALLKATFPEFYAVPAIPSNEADAEETEAV